MEAFLEESDVDSEDIDITNDVPHVPHEEKPTDKSNEEEETNFIRIPWEGEPPNIMIAESGPSQLKSPFDTSEDDRNDSMQCVRKVYFCRDLQDGKQRSLKVWDLPLTWNEGDIERVFQIFGDISSVCIKEHGNILSRHCLVRFKQSSNVQFALAYDSGNVVQPAIAGTLKFGVDKYLTQYIRTRPRNIDQLQMEVDRFMSMFEKLQHKKQAKLKQQPRRLRGWIQKRGPDGFTTVHYVSPYERRKHRAVRLPSADIQADNDNDDGVDGFGQQLGTGTATALNASDTFNAPPTAGVYNARKKQRYYAENKIKDVYAKRTQRIITRQRTDKQKAKQQITQRYERDNKQRMSIARVRLKQSMDQKQRWNKDMAHTTNSRKNRKFKPT